MKSFIYIKNNNGPKIDPLGTPEVIGMVSEMLPFTKILCFLFIKIRFEPVDMRFSNAIGQ